MRPSEEATELEYLRWFCINCDFGPAHGDVILGMNEAFEEETGKRVPRDWDDEEEE